MSTKPDKQKKKPGRKPDEEITKIAKSLGVSRQWAGQILKENEEAEGDAESRDIIALRCKRLQQQIEAAEIELARLRANDDETVPVRQLSEGLEVFLIFAEQYFRRSARDLSGVVGCDELEHHKEFEAFADGGFYSGLGAWFERTENTVLRGILRDLLSRGDWRHARGTSREETCIKHARHIAFLAIQEERTRRRALKEESK